MTDLGLHSEFERAGVWRRLFALLIDLIAITLILQMLALILFPLSHGRIQFAGGFNVSTCGKLESVPEGAHIPADFNPNLIAECQWTLFGLTSAQTLVVARSTREETYTKTVQIVRMLDADGVPVAGLSLDVLYLPLLILWRSSFDLGPGTPGRRMCRIRLASAGDGGPPPAAAVRRRYGLVFVILSPLLIWLVVALLQQTTAAIQPWLFWLALASYCPAVIVVLQAWRAVWRREDPWYDRFAETCVLRANATTRPAPEGDAASAPQPS